MAYSPPRHRASPPARYRSRSRSRTPMRSYREESEDANNPGNNLYVTGLSVRVTEKDLEEHFSKEGKVMECRLVVDPRTRESRGFGFVSMSNLKEADRCVKYLHRSTLEGRVITVEKAKRKRARTPTPGQYLGVRSIRSSREPAYSRDFDRLRGGRGEYEGRRRSSRYSPRYSPYKRGTDSPRYSSRDSPYRGRREQSISPHRSPYQSPPRRNYRSPSCSRSLTPYYNRR